MGCAKKITCFLIAFLLWVGLCFAPARSWAKEAAKDERIKQMREEAEIAKREARRMSLEKAKARLEERITEIDLPADTTQRFTVKQLRISSNELISSDKLFEKMPLIYNASDKPLEQAESDLLYDFRVLHEVILEPGQPRQVSARTVQGLTQYILSVYQKKNYAGIYVYVPSEAVMDGKKLRDEILSIKVLEAKVTDVTVKTYDPNQNETEKGYLLKSAVEDWSPIRVGQVTNQKEVDEFVNLLNLNPDRYVSAVVTKGTEPESLAVNYDIYEANPWHWFIQVDNSGTHERQWNPRIGVINTNLLGVDDTFTAIYQAPWDATIDENYSLFGSYDIPILGPRLRLNVYGGHSEFDISPETGGVFNFLGRGSFYGGMLRYNLLQFDGWFLDLKGGAEYTRSKVTPSLFPDFLGTDIEFWLWGGGAEMHRSDDISNSSLGFDRFESWGGESRGDEFNLARTGAESDFTIYTARANHSQYLDDDKISRITGSFRWIGSNERLVPAKMTAFGGMYSVRGYDEYEYIADGGILTSVQYEFDLVKYDEAQRKSVDEQMQKDTGEPFIKKLAPLVFWDYGKAKTVMPRGTEKRHEEFMSIGGGAILELGDNFRGAVYYGYPLFATEDTRTGDGRVNAYFLYQF